MQFPSADEDEGDFTLTTAARSRLSSLFQSENASGDVNQALTFQAPKQPRKNDNSQSSSGTFKLIHAATVHAYKFVDGNYVNQGKLGCAILGIHENSSYKFLLYKGKQVQVTSCDIVPSFKFHVQPNNYVNIYDEKNENWSLNFDNETALIEFAKQIAVSKANSEGKSQSTLVIQDLALGEGPSLDIGHSAEVKYTGWLLTNHSFGQVFDSNMKSESAFRLRLGKSKVIKGWSEGLIGAQKGSRRLLVIPPSLAYGAEGMGPSVPPNSTLIFDVLLTKVKISRESSNSPIPAKLPEKSSDNRPEVLPRSSFSQEDNIRMRGASISEQLTQSPKKDKAQLISRMAKMGTATLPLQGAIPAQVSSDSENEEDPPEEPQVSRSRTASPKSLSKPNSRHNSVSTYVVHPVQANHVQEVVPIQISQQPSQMPSYSQATLPAQQPYVSQNIGYSGYPTQLPSPFHMQQSQFQMPGMVPASSIADPHLPMLITETRSQNTEVRLSLSKITDKVDTLTQKVDDLRLQGRSSSFSPAAYMDTALLLQNIERIVQENIQLKEDAEIKNSKIQALNEKIYDLLQRNQRFFEESNSMLEQRSDSIQAVSSNSQAKLLNLEKEKEKLISDLTDATSKISVMESELNQRESQENHLKQKLLEYEKNKNENNESFVMLKQEYTTLQENFERLSKKYKEELSKSQESLKVDVSTNNEIETLRKENEHLSAQKDKLHSETDNLKMQLKSLETISEKKLQDLQTELKDSLAWKKKYSVFYEKTLKMKAMNDAHVEQLMTEIRRLQAAGSGPVSSDFSEEIKKVMNMLYKLLQGKFEANATYPGSKVLEMTLQTIRGLTFQMLQMKSRTSSNSSDKDIESSTESASSNTKVQQNGLAEDMGSSETKEMASDVNEIARPSSKVDKEGLDTKSTQPSSKVDEEGLDTERIKPSFKVNEEGLDTKSTQPSSKVDEEGLDSESTRTSSKVDGEGFDTNGLDSNNTDELIKEQESASGEKSMNDSLDAPNSIPEDNISGDSAGISKDSKAIEEVKSQKSASPDHLPSTADVPSDGSKV